MSNPSPPRLAGGPSPACRRSPFQGIRRSLPTLLVLVVAVVLPLAPSVGSAPSPAEGWICRPCDHRDHERIYPEPGRCPICGMELMRRDLAVDGSELDRREISFSNGDVGLAGVVLSPIGNAGKASPGLVIIHGSGAADRSQPWASAFARGLAARGFVVLLPDKRGSGRSGGDWRTASFEDLADDAVAAVGALRTVDGVDPDRVGVLGLSQGGHIAPLASRRSSGIAFVVDASGSALPITEQTVDEVEKLASRAGFTPEQIDRVNAIHRRAIHYGLTGEGWEEYEESLHRALDGDLAGHGVIEPFPRSRDHWVWDWARTVGAYDPLPHWEAMEVPAVIAYGARDTQIHVAESVGLLLGLPPKTGASRTVLVFGDSGHALRNPSTHRIRGDLLDFLASWVGLSRDRADGEP